MCPQVDFVPVATATGANVESQTDYLADPLLGTGNEPGIAKSAFVNKALRQATSMAAAIANFAANITGNNVLDDGNASELLATITEAFEGVNVAPTVQKFTSGSGTYTLPTSPKTPLYLKVKMVGGGGGGTGDTNGSTAAGGNGTSTIFGSVTAAGGSGGIPQNAGGEGGIASALPSGYLGEGFSGGYGAPSTNVGASGALPGGNGGSSPFGGEGGGGYGGSSPGRAAQANTGSGGAGGGGIGNSSDSGSGGGAGAYYEFIIHSPPSTIAYVVGTGGSGSNGTSSNGGRGADGIIVVEEYYQ